MTSLKTLSAIAVLSAMIATPVFAQNADVRGSQHKFYRTYNQVNAPYAAPLTNDEYWNLQNFGTTGRDPSRIGGESPWLNPAS
jgi:hypothetical protein